MRKDVWDMNQRLTRLTRKLYLSIVNAVIYLTRQALKIYVLFFFPSSFCCDYNTYLNGKNLETVTKFKYLGSVINDEGSKPEILSRIAWQHWNQFGMTGVIFFQFQDMTDALSYNIHLPVCLWIMDPHSRAPKKNTSHANEVIPQDTTHLIQRPCFQQGSPCQDPAGNRTTRRFSDDSKETQTAVVWSSLPFITSGLNHLARHSVRGKKTRQTKKYVGRQHQGMDRPGVRQVPEGSGEQGKMEETCCEIIRGAPKTLTVKG